MSWYSPAFPKPNSHTSSWAEALGCIGIGIGNGLDIGIGIGIDEMLYQLVG